MLGIIGQLSIDRHDYLYLWLRMLVPLKPIPYQSLYGCVYLTVPQAVYERVEHRGDYCIEYWCHSQPWDRIGRWWAEVGAYHSAIEQSHGGEVGTASRESFVLLGLRWKLHHLQDNEDIREKNEKQRPKNNGCSFTHKKLINNGGVRTRDFQ